jgi:hypothetical protein
MPQLDFGAWFNQTATVLLAFWLLIYLFIFVFLTQGTYLLKFRNKLTSLRDLVASTYSTQNTALETESAAVQLILLAQPLAVNQSLVQTNFTKDAELLKLVQETLNEVATSLTALETLINLELTQPVLAEDEATTQE